MWITYIFSLPDTMFTEHKHNTYIVYLLKRILGKQQYTLLVLFFFWYHFQKDVFIGLDLTILIADKSEISA